MSKQGNTILVSLSPSRYELFVLRDGAVVASRHARREVGVEDASWPMYLQQFEKTLAQWVAELDLAGKSCCVLHTSPESFSAVYEYDATITPANALSAAEMAAWETLGASETRYAVESSLLMTDQASTTDEAEGRKHHVLVAADTEANVLAMTMAIKGAGLACQCVRPTTAAAIGACIEQLSHRSNPGFVLWMGEHATVLAAGCTTKLEFVRTIPVGCENLIEALSQGPGVSLSASQAQLLLQRAGIPTDEDWQDSTTGLDTRTVMPLIQSILQKIIIEAKQSLRFGISDTLRETMSYEMLGPGSRIAGIDRYLAGGIGCDLVEQSTRQGDADELYGDAAALRLIKPNTVRLTPYLIKEKNERRKVQFALAGGVGLALLVMGVDAWLTHADIVQTEQTLASVGFDPNSPTLNAADIAIEKVHRAQQGLALARVRMLNTLERTPVVSELLAQLAELPGKSIALEEITFHTQNDEVQCVLRGRAIVSEEDGDSSNAVASFVDALEQSPLVERARLGETQRITGQQKSYISFQITIDLVALPFEARHGLAQADAGEELGR